MTEEYKMKRLVDINSEFDDFVKKYKEFCIDKILTDNTGGDIIDDFVKREIVIESENSQGNCLDELKDVSKIIEKLFESEETFIKAMDSDIAKFNELYNCYKYGNLDDAGIIIEKKAQISGEGRGDGVGEGRVDSGTGRVVSVPGRVPVGEGRGRGSGRVVSVPGRVPVGEGRGRGSGEGGGRGVVPGRGVVRGPGVSDRGGGDGPGGGGGRSNRKKT